MDRGFFLRRNNNERCHGATEGTHIKLPNLLSNIGAADFMESGEARHLAVRAVSDFDPTI